LLKREQMYTLRSAIQISTG